MGSNNGAERRRVLVVGMGIAGMATALRLHQSGWDPLIVEKAPSRRTGGYFIAGFGTGLAAAERLGVLDYLHDRTPSRHNGQYFVDRSGKARRGIGVFDLPVTPKPWLLLRGDVEQALSAALPDDVEVRYCTVPTEIEQDAGGVEVTLHDTASDTRSTERFDLVVGADGLRSTVRSLVFGPHERYLHRLDSMIGAFMLPRSPGGLAPGDGAMLFEPGRSMIVFPFADHPPTALLSWRSDDVDAEFTGPPAERIRAVFGPEPFGRMLGEVIDAFEEADTAIFDSAEQVHLDGWHRGRVVLVGDSAWCPTLYSGMGASTALAGADLLGAVLDQHPGNLEGALTDWERKLRPYTDTYQRVGLKGRQVLTPPTRLHIALRRTMTTLQRTPVIGPALSRRFVNSPDFWMRNTDITRTVQLAASTTPTSLTPAPATAIKGT
ncbi:FAD-dependent monooxygenase [Streptomyces sp. NPDC017260]|uniref:FAD-dependent monooxygenase n=1 Tax=unclassified Streptomyces TaxID=2593676 RepID=UPI0037A54734